MFSLIPGGTYDKFYSTDGFDARRIGHLRFDFDSGEAFFSSWWRGQIDVPYDTELFDKEFDNLVRFLRKGLLASAAKVSMHARKLDLPTLDDDHYFICNILTDQHEYYVRVSPDRGYYGYIYCYLREK